MKKNLTVLSLLAVFVLASCNDTSAMQPTDPPEGQEIPVAELLVGEIDVAVNPYNNAPLGAEVSFTTNTPVEVTFEVLGEEPLAHTFEEAATEHTLPLLGLYGDTANEVRVLLQADETYAETTLEVQTEPLPDFLPTIEVTVNDADQVEPGWTFSTLRIDADPYWFQPIVFDNSGTIRWYLDAHREGRISAVRRLENGNLIFEKDSTLFEYSVLGEEVRRWELEGYNPHHEVVEKPDGNLIVAVDNLSLETIEDHIVELDRDSGEIIKVWDLRQILDVDRTTYEDEPGDWLHMNAVFYNEPDDTLIISGRNQGIIKVTQENELVWILAPHKGWEQAGIDGDGLDTTDFLLTALDEEGNPYSQAVQLGDENTDTFDWTWGQHAPLILSNGNLLLFDNGRKRTFDPDGPKYSRAVEYVIDEEALTIEQVWQYGEERGEAFFSPIISDVDVLSETGNRLVMPGIVGSDTEQPYAFVTELTYPGEEIVYEAKINFANAFESENMFKDSVYRSERLSLYP